MTLHRQIRLSLSRPLIAKAAAHAAERRLNLGVFLHGTVQTALPGDREPRIAPAAHILAADLAAEFADATNWLDLQRRLRNRGFILRLHVSGALFLHAWPTDRKLVAIEALDQSMEALSLRFRALFPGATAHKPALSRPMG